MQTRKFSWNESILYEDEQYLVICKPPFLSSLSDRMHEDNLLDLARERYGNIQIAHRLDRDTSGVLVFAKNPDSYRHLSIQFEHREVKKTYHAVCDGVHNFNNQKIDLPLYTSGKGLVKVDHRRGKESTTYIHTLKAYPKHTLVECSPVTGRTHQIRVHLSSIGAPISGDSKYGGKPFFLSEIKKKYNVKKFTEEEPLVKRMALHAQSIEFKDQNDNTIQVMAEYPKDMQVMLRQLTKNS